MTSVRSDAPAVGAAAAEVVGPDLMVVAPVRVPPRARAWLGLAASLALADGLRAVARVPAEVAWPDAVTVQRAMCGGSGGAFRTAEVRVEGGSVAARISLMGSSLALPAGWTSVWSEGGKPDVEPIVEAYVAALHERVAQLLADDPRLAADYRLRCVTLGRLVDIAGQRGIVDGIDADAALLATVDGVQHRLDPADAPRI